MTQVCENERTVKAILKPITNQTQMLDPEMDLVLAINHKCKRMVTDTDDTKDNHDRNNKEKLNIIGDQILGDERRHGTTICETPYRKWCNVNNRG